ncbi:NAD-dependent epimerase/dehydratase family protein [Helicobacter cholecystus]|uniref:NAD-dependent epimerase/dehydratase family protein n=1 Tax=Helicobacter cholecystus TaxID=45498 RepID=UPI002738D8A8|nr:NAD(P)-dependent oxidoreductase [Helicobacter cholecystus]
MQNKILLTGVTGFLGSEVCKHLLALDYQVIGIGRKQYGFLSKEVLNHQNFYFIQLELKDLNEEILKDFNITSCIHLASMVEYASYDYHDYHDYHDYTITPTLNILKLTKNSKLKKIIYSSTSSVITKPSPNCPINEESPVSPMSNYGLSKYICEKLLEMECNKNPNLTCIALRFPAIYGRNHLGGIVHTLKEDAINNRKIELYGEGKYLRNILYVQDAVNAIILALESEFLGYELFNIGAKTSLSVLQITQELIKLLDSKSKIELSQKISPNHFNTILDISKAQNILKFQPKSIQEGLKLYIQDLKGS